MKDIHNRLDDYIEYATFTKRYADVVFYEDIKKHIDELTQQHEAKLKAVRQDLGLCAIALNHKTTLLNSCEEALIERDAKHKAEHDLAMESIKKLLKVLQEKQCLHEAELKALYDEMKDNMQNAENEDQKIGVKACLMYVQSAILNAGDV